MFPKYTDILAHQEHYKELLRETELERLVRAAARSQPDRSSLGHFVVNWLRAQLLWRESRRARAGRSAPAAGQS
jgi:hypothetical protein